MYRGIAGRRRERNRLVQTNLLLAYHKKEGKRIEITLKFMKVLDRQREKRIWKNLNFFAITYCN